MCNIHYLSCRGESKYSCKILRRSLKLYLHNLSQISTRNKSLFYLHIIYLLLLLLCWDIITHYFCPISTVVFLNETVDFDPYDECANRSEPVFDSTTPSPTVAYLNQTGNITLGVNATFPPPTTSAPEIPATTPLQDICEEEETLLFGMAAVVSTTIYSSREGAVCYFAGGNRHDPFNPGKYKWRNWLENNDCVTCVVMVLFRNQRLLFWSEEFVRGVARGTISKWPK